MTDVALVENGCNGTTACQKIIARVRLLEIYIEHY